MIIYLNEDGSISNVYPSVLTQGSNIGQIVAFGKNLSSFSTLKINFTLPNGQLYYGGEMTPTNATGYNVNQEIVRIYTKTLNKSLTHYAGTLQMSITAKDASGNEVVSFIGSATINQTIPQIPTFPEITQSAEDIIGDIEDIYEVLVALYEGLVVENTQIVKKAKADQNGNVINTTYQTITDNNLTTTQKTIVGAINELKAAIEGSVAVPYATTEVAGKILLATNEDITTGTNTNKSVSPKQLVDTIESKISGVLRYKGVWDITGAVNYSFFETYMTTYDTGIKTGWRWECTGTQTTIDGITYTSGDFVTFNQDVAKGTTVVSSMIDKTDNTDAVTSVNGETGNVVLTAGDLDTYTKAEVDALIGAHLVRRAVYSTGVSDFYPALKAALIDMPKQTLILVSNNTTYNGIYKVVSYSDSVGVFQSLDVISVTRTDGTKGLQNKVITCTVDANHNIQTFSFSYTTLATYLDTAPTEYNPFVPTLGSQPTPKQYVDNQDVDYIGREQLLGFEVSSVEDGVATAELDVSLSDFVMNNSTGFLFDVIVPSSLSASITDTTKLVLQDKDGNDININCIFQDDKDETSTFGDLKQITTTSTAGMELEFYGHYSVFAEGGTTYRVIYTDTVVDVKGAEKVTITLLSASQSSGTLTDAQYNTLIANDNNFLETIYDGHTEKYIFETEASSDGWRIYSHSELENNVFTKKFFTITESVKSWVITEKQNIENYNSLTNKPIINADLTSIVGQVNNQVYRHTGSTTASFTQYKLYSYDGTIWSEIGASGATYTAGDGINITDNEISVKVGDGLFFNSYDEVSLNNASQQAINAVPTKVTNPMSSSGDLIVGGESGTPTRLPMGTAGQVLKVNSAGTGLEYGSGAGGSSNYNDLSNKPIINADLDATSASTATQNQLYRHSGASATNYKIGMLYYSNGTSWVEYTKNTIATYVLSSNQHDITLSGLNLVPHKIYKLTIITKQVGGDADAIGLCVNNITTQSYQTTMFALSGNLTAYGTLSPFSYYLGDESVVRLANTSLNTSSVTDCTFGILDGKFVCYSCGGNSLSGSQLIEQYSATLTTSISSITSLKIGFYQSWTSSCRMKSGTTIILSEVI